MNIGRPRKLAPEAILEIAMDVFWEKGYEATSIADILKATGLHKGSLYQTFGDKKKLFIACLTAYQHQMFEQNKQIIESESDPIVGLKKSLLENVSTACTEGKDSNKGCMAVNTLVETAPHDDEIRDVLEKNEEKFHHYIISLLENAEKNHGYTLKFPPEMLFAMIMTFMCGLSSVMKNLISEDEGYQLLETQLQLLGLS